MATGIVLHSLYNLQDGVHARATVYGTPSGSLIFLFADTPEIEKATQAPAVPDGQDLYMLLMPRIGLWYVWAQDDDGATAPQAVWLGLSDDPDIDLCGEFLADALRLHEMGLQTALRSFFHDGTTIKSISYGSVFSIDEFPAILVTKPRESVQPVLMPLVDEHTFRFEILIFVPHQERSAYLRVAGVFCARVMEILNRPVYRDFQLKSGQCMGMCIASEGQSDEVQEDDKTWTALASVVWSGSAWIAKV